MSRYAVATDTGEERCFFRGSFYANPDEQFRPVTTTEPLQAFTHAHRAAADAVASGLIDLSRCLPPFDARTWFVCELPEPRK
jgi:hypothetical protein